MTGISALKGPKTVTHMKIRNQMFRELGDYYEHHFEEVAIRIGNLVSFVEEFSSAVTIKRKDLLIAMRLNDRTKTAGAHKFLWDNATCM
ncbi:hypothetical protein M3Y96_00556800 [Aphelenchoides besseyi]|nr:hypothetical protein M3Y96_00556800 [Aphelenchoides besseyi]